MQRLFVLILTICAPFAARSEDAATEARGMIHAGDRAGATQFLEGVLARDPGQSGARAVLVELRIYADHVDEAHALAEAGLKLKPSDSEAHRAKGEVLFREGYIFQSEAEFKAAYNADGHNARALLGIARVFNTGCLRKQAKGLIERAYKLAPDDEGVASLYRSSRGDWQARIEQMEQDLDTLDPDDPDHAAHVQAIRAQIESTKKLSGKLANEVVDPSRSYRIPINLLRDGRRAYGLALPVSIGNAKAQLQLDTGAGGFLINSRMAERAGVERLADSDIRGIGNKGAAGGYLGFAESLKVGDLEFRNVLVHVSDKHTALQSEGLIGTDVFQRFLVKMDFREMRLRLDALPGPAWDGHTSVDRYDGPEVKGWGQFLRLGHFILIPTRISDGPPVLFLVDTGAGLSLVSTKMAPTVTKLRSDSRNHLRGLEGEVKMMYSADKVTLEFAGFRQVNQDLTAIDLSRQSHSSGIEVSGIMGLPLLTIFASITLDYRDGRVLFEYKR